MSLSADRTDFGAAQRAQALADLMVLDTPDEQAFDDLVLSPQRPVTFPSRSSPCWILTGNGSKPSTGLRYARRRSNTRSVGSRSIKAIF